VPARRIVLLIVCIVLLGGVAPRPASAVRSARGDYDWAVTAYRGWLTEATLGEMISFDMTVDTEFSYWAFALTRKITEITDSLNLEGEGIIVKYTGEQDHLELDALFSGRWLNFPWNRYVDTTTAFGLGLSFASEKPYYEERNKGETEQLLAFLLFEITVGVPKLPRWDLAARINHRSGAFGLFNGMHGAMNSVALGLKYRF
jgi:hypothetical protein